MEDVDIGRRFEFHTHTFYSDGVLSPAELIRHCVVKDCEVVAITDHVDFTNLDHVLKCQKKIVGEISWDIKVLIGVELTHIPKDKIAKLAEKAKSLGADIVVAHGETTAEPVEKGTNNAAVNCEHVDILAHPGVIAVEDAEKAKENNIFLELTTRRGHLQTNNHVAKTAFETDAKLLLNTDAHEPADLMNQIFAYRFVLGLRMDKNNSLPIVKDNPREFMKRFK